MQPAERDAAYLWDMQQAAIWITEFIQEQRYHDFQANKMLQSAVERQLEIIGEAARYVSKEFRVAHPEIPWRSIIGLRNILAHEYGEIKIDRVWAVAEENIPELIQLIGPLLPPLDEE